MSEQPREIAQDMAEIGCGLMDGGYISAGLAWVKAPRSPYAMPRAVTGATGIRWLPAWPKT